MGSIALDAARRKILHAELCEIMPADLINIVVCYLNYTEAQKVWLALHTDKYDPTNACIWRSFSVKIESGGWYTTYVMSIIVYAQNAEAARAENDSEWREGDQNKFQICFDNIAHMGGKPGPIIDITLEDLLPSKGFHPAVNPRLQIIVNGCRTSFIETMLGSIDKIGT